MRGKIGPDGELGSGGPGVVLILLAFGIQCAFKVPVAIRCCTPSSICFQIGTESVGSMRSMVSVGPEEGSVRSVLH